MRRSAIRLFSSSASSSSSLLISAQQQQQQQQTGVVTITLNRPKALNALDLDMCASLKETLLQWRRPSASSSSSSSSSPPRLFILKSSSPKAFCAGGDVKSVYTELLSLPPEAIGTGAKGTLHADFFRTEYEMNYLLATSPVPQISLWDGIVMGGGVGVSMYGRYRVATEKTLFAMPETNIGLFPDVGASSWLPLLMPKGLGLLLGMSGKRLTARELIDAGIATHYVHSSKLPELEAALSSSSSSSPSSPGNTLDMFCTSPPPPSTTSSSSSSSSSSAYLATRVFGGEAVKVQGILDALEHHEDKGKETQEV